jgi:hypothetical protein
MHTGFLGAFAHCAIACDDDWTDDFIALLRGVVERQLRVVCIREGQHRQASMRLCWDVMSQAIGVEWPKANRTGADSRSTPQLRPPFRVVDESPYCSEVRDA